MDETPAHLPIPVSVGSKVTLAGILAAEMLDRRVRFELPMPDPQDPESGPASP